MKKTLILLIVLLCPNIFGQSIEWAANYANYHNDYFYSAHKLPDGNLIFGGSTRYDNTENEDFWLVKTDANGTVLWEQTYGGSGFEKAYTMIPTTDGGFLLGGSGFSTDGDGNNNNGNSDFWLIKTDANGVLQWQQNYGGSEFDNMFAMQEISNGDFILAGNSRSSNGDVGGNNGSWDVWVVRVNAQGDLLWEQNYGGSNFERIDDMLQTSNGEFLIAGYTESNDGDITDGNQGGEAMILKIDGTGNLIWLKTYGNGITSEVQSLLATDDGKYVFVGRGKTIKIDDNGNIEWEQNYSSQPYVEKFAIVQTPDGGYIEGGVVMSYENVVVGPEDPIGHWDYWISKTDALGNIEWEESYNYNGTSSDEIETMILCDDGSLILVGNSRKYDFEVNDINTDAWVLKINLLEEVSNYCFMELDTLDLSRQGALSAAHTDIIQTGSETYTWYNADNQVVAQFIGQAHFSPSEIGTYYAIVRDEEGVCQVIGPRTITELDGCCELEGK